MDALCTRLPQIFSPGVADHFHKNFSLYQRFVSDIENCCCTQTSVKRLRSGSVFSAFRKRWSLPVYFQLRFQEIAGSFEASVFDDAVKLDSLMYNAISTEMPLSGSLFPTQSLIKSIQRCWSAEVLLSPLIHRFWKLTLQLLSRYAAWMTTLSQSPDVLSMVWLVIIC